MHTLKLNPEDLLVESCPTAPAPLPIEMVRPRTDEPGCTSPTFCNPTNC